LQAENTATCREASLGWRCARTFFLQRAEIIMGRHIAWHSTIQWDIH